MTKAELDTLQQRSGGFLRELRITRTGCGVRLLARYDQHRFSPELFARLNVDRPGKLAHAVDKRLAEFLAGRALALAAQEALGHPPQQVRIGEDRAPIWPKGLAGSISHARGHCACYLLPAGHGHPGIDIEAIASGQGLEAIMRMTVNADEAAVLLTADDPAIAATLCFSAKETLFKALYPVVRRHFGFKSAELRALPAPNQLTLNLTETLAPSLPSAMSFDIAFHTGHDHVVTWLWHPAVNDG